MPVDLPAYVPWIIFLPALAALVQNFFGKRLPGQGDRLVVLAMAGSLTLSVMTLFAWAGLKEGNYFHAEWTWFELAGGVVFKLGILVDGLTSALLCVVTLVATLVFLFSTGYMKGDEYYHRFFFWLSFFGVAMLILTLADNLLTLFVGWELVGLCSYKLIGFWSKDLANAEAAKKAFMTTRVGDLFMLMGMLVVYANIGSFGFREIFAGIQAGQLAGTTLTLAGIGIFMGAVGKSAQFPLQVWLPDAMAGPTPVSALIHAATMVAAGVYLAARMFPMFSPDALQFIAWTGGITAVMAALIAFTQTDIKKVLAYSTISQLGYMMLGVGVGAPGAGMFHLTTHAFFKACLFLGSGSVIFAMHHAQDLKDMGGLRKKLPVTFWTFVIATLALAGIPFMSGFFSKDAILFTALRHQQYVLFAMGFFGAFLTAFYMTRMVWLCFFGEPRNREKYDHAKESPWTMTLPLVVLAALSFGPIYTLGHFSDRFFATPANVVDYPDSASVAEAYVIPEGLRKEHEAAERKAGREPLVRVHPVPAEVEHHPHPLWFTVLAWSLGAIGIAIGFALFRSGKRDEKSRILPGGLHGLCEAKYYMDEFYLDGVVAATNRVSDTCAAVDADGVDGLANGIGRGGLLLGDISGDVDNVVVDGAVNLTADVAQGAGALGSAAQTGRVRNYLTMALGTTVLIVLVILLA